LTFLLDTNACIAALNGRPALVRDRITLARSAGSEITVSSIAMFELWHGVGRSVRAARNADRLVIFRDSVDVLPFDEEDARVAGGIEADLRSRGTPIGPYDVLMAGQAVRRGLTLVTANVREFARVPSLRWEDWSQSSNPSSDC
jgi:tRNA(fMet)-specific endonuclease VapC